MLKEQNNKSLAFGLPGLLIQTIGLFIHPIIALVGSGLLIVGLGYYAKAKGHSGYFGLFGLLSWLGVIVLIALKDKCISPEEQEAKKKTKPKNVVFGIILGLGLVIGIPLLLVFIFSVFVK
jgi:hypothetical protein